MTTVHLQQVEMLYLLWGVPLLGTLYLYAGWRRRQALAAFVEAGLISQLRITVSAGRRRRKAALVLLGFLALVVALARPGWNPQPKTLTREGRDVVFVLDVSRSMLAEDLAPNRLERAKLAIMDCIDKLGGDRVGLVAFAGTAAVKCPLTLDYGFFRMMLADIAPDSIAQGGTMIGDALRRAADDVFDDQLSKYKDIVLITDGGDQESLPEEAAAAAAQKGIRLLAVGLGSAEEGRRIPVTNEAGERTFLKYEGREVVTRLDAETLRRMVSLTPGGKYLPVGTGTFDLGSVYSTLIAGAEKRAVESQTAERYEEKFQIFLGLGILLLGIETVTGERRREGVVT